MLSRLFINLFKIEEQGNWYWNKAALLIETRTELKQLKNGK